MNDVEHVVERKDLHEVDERETALQHEVLVWRPKPPGGSKGSKPHET